MKCIVGMKFKVRDKIVSPIQLSVGDILTVRKVDNNSVYFAVNGSRIMKEINIKDIEKHLEVV